MRYLSAWILVGTAMAGCGAATPAAPASSAAEPPEPASRADLKVPTATARGQGPGDKPLTPAVDGTMLDVEAWIDVRVPDLSVAGDKARGLSSQLGATIVSDRLEGATPTDEWFTIRVPSPHTTELLSTLARLGTVLRREVQTKDVGKDYYDGEIQLRSLQVSLKRYEELLSHAKDVSEMLRIEAELGRLRTAIEQVEGNLRYLRDRTARSTVHLRLFVPSVEPQKAATIWPGLRVTTLTDFKSQGRTTYAGFGFSLPSRAFSIDVDAFERPSDGRPGLDAFMLTVGGETYSSFLGGGHRRWFNPYLGVRAGYAHVWGDAEAVLGWTAGVEVYSAANLRIDAAFRGLLLFANKDVDPHPAAQPTLAVHWGF